MKINSIHLENFRGFEKADIELHPKLNVFYGLNGSGKSSVLDGISKMLGMYISKIMNDKKSNKVFLESDIKLQKGFLKFHISIDTNINQDRESIQWSYEKKIESQDSKSNFNSLRNLYDFINKNKDNFYYNPNHPIIVSYPSNRHIIEKKYDPFFHSQKKLLGFYLGALQPKTDFIFFFNWFKEKEDIENEIYRYKGSELNERSEISVVRQAIQTFLPDFKDLRINRHPDVKMVVTKENQNFSINQLSDGEKSLIALFGDIARRLAMANKDLSNPLEGNGVVLIDEIDLHLHPQWQRKVIEGLMSTFPKVQFIITTHSPLVLSHVKPENLFMLQTGESGIEIKQFGESYGKTAERILEDLMGLDTTRPNSIQKEFEQLSEFINKNQLEDAKGKLKELRELIGMDPDLVSAEIWIDRKEKLRK